MYYGVKREGRTGLEDLQELQGSVAGVFDIMAWATAIVSAEYQRDVHQGCIPNAGET